MAGGVNGLEPFCGGDRDFSGMLGHGSQNTGMAAGVKPRSREAARLDCRHSSRCGHRILLGRAIVHGQGCTYHPRHCRIDDPAALMWTLRMLAKT
jgi:hypothetical protein